jgi:hypothetical protein
MKQKLKKNLKKENKLLKSEALNLVSGGSGTDIIGPPKVSTQKPPSDNAPDTKLVVSGG